MRVRVPTAAIPCACAAMPSLAAAQQASGRVFEADGRVAVAGAVEFIPQFSEPLTLTAADSVSVTRRFPPRGQSLGAVRVVTDSKCRANPERTDRTAQLWQEIRTALEASAATERERRTPLELTISDHRLDALRRRLGTTRLTVRNWTGAGFLSAPPDELAAKGVRAAGGRLGGGVRPPRQQAVVRVALGAAHAGGARGRAEGWESSRGVHVGVARALSDRAAQREAPAAYVVGRAMDCTTMRPLTGAEVRLEGVGSVTTGADGRFGFEGKEPLAVLSPTPLTVSAARVTALGWRRRVWSWRGCRRHAAAWPGDSTGGGAISGALSAERGFGGPISGRLAGRCGGCRDSHRLGATDRFRKNPR